MFKILKSKKGITLVELIIGMVVLAIILATVSAILFPMMRFQARANEFAEQNALLDDLANQIIYDISMATGPLERNPNVPITATPPHTLEPGSEILIIPLPAGEGGNITYNISPEGIIIRAQADESHPLLPGEFHRRMNETGLTVESIVLTLDNTTGIVYTLALTLENENLTFARDYATRPLALNQIHNS